MPALFYTNLVLLTSVGPEARCQKFDVAPDSDLKGMAHMNKKSLDKIVHNTAKHDLMPKEAATDDPKLHVLQYG
ncbi:hypothetical protein PHYSODRAFT_324793 [Phytophthora sojae]|uniref:Uncharacterized protein n=1 Tax=Phytophthora sojae (strain P6497) TaxID=1094619 RepID=G4YU46_PHYSP|nr:hypothetical protein PHYSODRAFT_324793 [Phytophthora sojae]EGZ23601.1 hypothetical protein PHYSODRAFT_324793 [Phytophthora sojae]|eukprot:XP_009518889.1 hypothetical protein PHYSODRAFT_324793 [Phytophthora sojae]